MKVSINSIHSTNKRYGSAGDPAPEGVQALLRKIGAQLAGVEEVIPYGERFKGVIVARVVSVSDHPDADRLHVCMIDDGGQVQNVERDTNGYVQVVCGAPNVRAGLSVAWLPPGSTVPSSFASEPFTLEARALRGILSNGMLASPRELTIGDNHDGIMELDTDAAPGTPFVVAYDLEQDMVIDMENKMFTHRPDCFGQLGVAREIEGIQQRPYKSPEWYRLDPVFPGVEAEELTLEVRNEIPALVPRFTAITMRDVVVKPSPVWLQIYLSELGIRPINNIVDYTNFFMLETGQPLHAYDYDKVKAQDADASHATLVIRHPKADEQLTLLNGKNILPRSEAIMIATNDTLIGLGGVMGGGDTEVDEHTRNIIIECANFDMYSVRRTSMAHGIFTDAVSRFNKGQSPLQTPAVLAKIVDEIRRFADGKVASAVIDDVHVPEAMRTRGSVHPPVHVTDEFINARLGLHLDAEEMAQLLRNVEFTVDISDGELTVTAPFWRTDIEIPEDVVEEVGRLFGYDHLPLELPRRDLTPTIRNSLFSLRHIVRSVLAAAGANEALTYSFVHQRLLDKVGQDAKQAFKLSNALSPDLQYYRLSVLPSLLEKVHANVKAGHDTFALFELGKAHNVLETQQDGLPKEVSSLAFVFTAHDKVAAANQKGAPYFQAKQYLTHVLHSFGAEKVIRFVPLVEADLYDNPWLKQMAAPFEPARSAVLQAADGLIWGVVGEFRRAVQTGFKLPAHTAGFEFDPLLLFEGRHKPYRRLPRFPAIEQDICLKVPTHVAYADVYECADKTLDDIQPTNAIATLRPIDIYQRPDDPEHKQVTLRYSLASFERTLTDEEVAKLLDTVAGKAAEKLGAERI